jgi:hypothetical protein
MLFFAVRCRRSVVKDRERHTLPIALIVRLEGEIICNLPGPQKRGTGGTLYMIEFCPRPWPPAIFALLMELTNGL